MIFPDQADDVARGLGLDLQTSVPRMPAVMVTILILTSRSPRNLRAACGEAEGAAHDVERRQYHLFED